MFDRAREFFSTAEFMPHGHCYLWNPGLIWLHVISDGLIGLAYLAISLTLYFLVRKIRLPFSAIILAFGLFIGACGATHFMEIYTLWVPQYWLGGLIKLVTAIASVATGILLFPVKSKVIELVESAKLGEQRRIDLEMAHRELERLYKKVQETDRLKTEFFSNVSHELRTPLTLILGPAARILANDALNPADRHSLEVVLRNAKLLLKHVNELLDIARLETGALGPRYVTTDVSKLVQRMASNFETAAETRGIGFAIQTPAKLTAEIDPDKVERVLLNLFSNAFAFTPDQGKIECRLEEKSDRFEFRIEDSGPGIAPELRERVFDRFVQADSSSPFSRPHGGSGLGLAIVKEFVGLHAGRVTIDASALGGAGFVVSLPLRAPANIPVAAEDSGRLGIRNEFQIEGTLEELKVPPSVLAGEPRAKAPRPGRPSLLVVEDNLTMNQFLRETLEDDFNVATASRGLEAMELLKQKSFDLVLTDIMMPGMGGEGLIAHIRQNPDLQNVPIIALTAKSDDEFRVKILRNGAQDYVVKPFSAEELRTRVENLVAIKISRELLEKEVTSQSRDLVQLTQEVLKQKRQAETAFEAAQFARQEAERANRVKSTFLSLVSHELRSPLTAMQLSTHILSSGKLEPLKPAQVEMTNHLASSLKRMISLVETLLEYTRIESGRVLTQVEAVDLGRLVSEIEEGYRLEAASKKLTLKTVTMADLPPLMSDDRLIKIVLNNFLTNALKYTERGQIEISVGFENGFHRLAVSDTGVGIRPEDQNRIFKAFEQLEPLQHKTSRGVGLGLALVKEIVGVLKGEIQVKSAPGQGSTFTVKLPNLPSVE